MGTISEALKYLFSYADTVGKPIVVNMSLGGFEFPYDDNNLQDLQISEVLNENPNGKILVASAGNRGNRDMHLEYNFSNNDTLKCHAILRMQGYLSGSRIV
jgi:hypothetical protein